MESTLVNSQNNNLVRKFMCATRFTPNDFENMSNDVVASILMMLSHPILEKYPLKTSYLSRVLKTIINQMKNAENEIWDELYLKYVEVISKESFEGPFYKHYVLGNFNSELFQSAITIQESTSIVSQGTTGLCTWQAGVALSCWCLKNAEKLKDKFIVELGCGTGLSGISACINCEPREYWFTDCHPTVLNALKHNIEINEMDRKSNCKYDTIQLSWDDEESMKMFENKRPDLVLAADVVFDQTMFEPLCNYLKYFSTIKTEIILFCTLRNHETYEHFLKTIRTHIMNFTEDILPDNYDTVLQQECPIYILNIK